MSALILALNPSIDAEWRVDNVVWEEKNNVQSERRWAGGKGINVARWLGHLGVRSQLLLPLGGATGKELAAYLRAEKIRSKIIKLSEPTRVNVILTTAHGRQMRLNPLGPKLSSQHWAEVLREVKRSLPRFELLILSGSLPRGLPPTVYEQLIRLAHGLGIKTILDCDGPVFAAGVKAKPFLVKPNEHELAQWWGKPLRSESAILQAARKLSQQTQGWVLASRGDQRSLLLNVGAEFSAFAQPKRVKPRNTVGAGDALLAAVVAQIIEGKSPDQWLAKGLSVGTAATQLEPGHLPA